MADLPERTDAPRFVQEMYVPQLTISHYDADTLAMIARDICERYKIGASLIKLHNCDVREGVIVDREPLEWRA